MTDGHEIGRAMTKRQIDRIQASLCSAVAQEMRAVRMLIEELAEALVSDERLATDHIGQFQTFDLVVQQAQEGADLLDRVADGQDIHAAVGLVRLDAMQARLRAAITGA
jgi:nucleoid DNA-binding protein